MNLADCEPGAKSHIENILLGLHGLNWKITLFSCGKTMDNQPDFPFDHKRIKKRNHSVFEQVKEQIRLFFLLFTLKGEMPDAVYIRTSPLLIVPILFSLVKNIPFYLEENAAMGFSSPGKISGKISIIIARAFENWALRRSKAIITTTDELKTYFSLRTSLDPEKIHVIPMGFESDLFNSPVTETCAADDKKAKFTIGFLGQFHKRQGLTDLINAIPLVISKHENVRFKIAGKGDMEHELKTLVERLQIKKFVKFTGFLDTGSIPGFLNRCDLAAAPYFGGFNQNIPMGSPTKTIQYLASGTPVVTTRLPSLDLFRPCKAVFFCEPDNPEDLAGIIIDHIRKTPAQRHELGKAGYDFVNRHFTWGKLSKKTSRILENGRQSLKTEHNP